MSFALCSGARSDVHSLLSRARQQGPRRVPFLLQLEFPCALSFPGARLLRLRCFHSPRERARSSQPGTFLAVTQGSTSATWRIHVVDRSHRSIQTLAIGGITWSGRAPYRVFIEDDKHFLIGVMQGRPAIWRASWTGSSWHATQLAALNASPVPVLWDIERIGPWIYMSTSSSGNNAYDGIVWRLSAAAPHGLLALGSAWFERSSGSAACTGRRGARASCVHVEFDDTDGRSTRFARYRSGGTVDRSARIVTAIELSMWQCATRSADRRRLRRARAADHHLRAHGGSRLAYSAGRPRAAEVVGGAADLRPAAVALARVDGPRHRHGIVVLRQRGP
jgi:hypothetical protein